MPERREILFQNIFRMKTKIPGKIMTFKEAVEATPDVANGYQSGLNAIENKYRNRIQVSNTRLLNGSVDIDSCTTCLYPNDNRWDYAFSYNQKVYFMEVHSANTHEVSVVLSKLKWLKDWLVQHAPDINKLKAPQPYFWIQSKGFAVLPTSPQYKNMVQKGLKPIAILKLK